MSDTAEPAAPSEAVAPPQAPGAPPLLEVRGLAKYYGNIIALEDISTTVEAGKVTCVLGDNGAGKSSFIKILSGVHQHDAGEVLLDGEEVQFKSPARRPRPRDRHGVPGPGRGAADVGLAQLLAR